jgi:hypothetical protein
LTNSFVGVWEGYCEQFSGTHGSSLKCTADGCRQTYRISYDATHTEYESGAILGTCLVWDSASSFLTDSFKFPESWPNVLSPLQKHSADTWAAGYALLASHMPLNSQSVQILLRSPLLALSGPCDIYILGRRMSVNDAGVVFTVPCSWQTHCFSQTLQLVGYPPFNVGCSGHALSAANVNQSSIAVSSDFATCIAKWFSVCMQFSNISSLCVAPVMINTQASRFLQEIIAVNGSHVTIKAPGLIFAIIPGSFFSCALPSASQTKSFGMFDSLAAPAVYPIFAVTKASRLPAYSPHDNSMLYDSNLKSLSSNDHGSSTTHRPSDIQYAAVLSVARNADDPSHLSASAACPSVVIAAPILIASNDITVRPDRAPTVRSCFPQLRDDGSSTTQWVSEVQLSNHLSMPFVVSAALSFCACAILCSHSSVDQPSLDYLDVLDLGSVVTLTYLYLTLPLHCIPF